MIRKYWWIILLVLFVVIGVGFFFSKSNPAKQIFVEPVTDEPFKGAMGDETERDGIFHSLVVSPTDQNTVYIGTETNGIFKSTDGGNTWQWLRTGILHNERSYPEVYDIIINPNNENHLYAALTNGPIPPYYEKAAGFYYSFDAGQSWQRSISGLPNTGIDSLGVDPNNPSIIYLGLNAEDPSFHIVEDLEISGGIYKSTDDGNSWQPLSHPEKIHASRIEHILINGNTVIANGIRFKGEDSRSGPRSPDIEGSIGLIKSTDAGKSWQNITPKGAFAYYWDASADLQTIYITGDQGDGHISTNGGETWAQSPVYTGGVIRVSPFDKKTVYFATGNQIQRSTDGLQSSHQIFQTEPNLGIDDIEFTSDPNIIYMAGSGYRVYKSVDGGNFFTQIANLRDYINSQP